MKTILLSLMLLTTSLFACNAQVMNQGFEDLNTDGSIQYWGIMHLLAISIDTSGNTVSDSIVVDQSYCQTSTDAHSGLRAVEMRNAFNYTTNTAIPGGAFLSADTIFSTYSGFGALLSRPQSLGFYYKYFPVNNDTASAWIDVMNNNSNVIGHAEIILTSAASTYTFVSTPIVYTTSDSAVAAMIHFNASARGTNAQFGTRFLVDDVNLATPAGTSDMNQENGFVIFPNPASTTFRIQSDAVIEAVDIYDFSGRAFYHQSGDHRFLNCSFLVNGLYTVKVKTEKGIQIGKLTIQH